MYRSEMRLFFFYREKYLNFSEFLFEHSSVESVLDYTLEKI